MPLAGKAFLVTKRYIYIFLNASEGVFLVEFVCLGFFEWHKH